MSKNKTKTDCVVGWLVRESERVLSGRTAIPIVQMAVQKELVCSLAGPSAIEGTDQPEAHLDPERFDRCTSRIGSESANHSAT